MLTLLVALAVLIAGVAPAHAAFLIAPVVGLLGLTGIAATVATAAIGVGLAVGVSVLANRLLRPKAPSHQPQEQPAGGVELDVRLDADVPQSIIFGRAVTAGSRTYAETYSVLGGAPNNNLVEIIAVADHPCEGLVKVFVEGQDEPFSSTGDNRGNTLDNYQTRLAFRFFDGTQTSADSFTVSALGGHSERPWTSDMIGHGRTYVRNHYIYNQELVPSLMRWKYVVDGIKLYDPRKDSTVGGSGSHRFGNLGTHEFTQNLIVIAYNILRGVRVADHTGTPRHFYGLENTPAANLPLDVWFAAMNEADLTVDGEPQFHGGAEIGVDTEPLEVVREILKACDGRLVEIGGVYKVYVGPPGLPVMSFNDSHIRVDAEEAFKPIRPLVERINHVAGKFTSPEDGWIPKVAPARVDADSEAADGRRVTGELDAPWVQSGKHIQRLQKQMLFRARKERRHTLPLPPEMYGLEPGDIIEWTSQRNGYIDKLFEVEAVQDHHDLTSTITILELDEDDYDWFPESDLIPFPDGSLVQGRPAPRVVNDFQAVGVIHQSGGKQLPAILLTWTPPDDDDVTGVAWQLRVAADPDNATSGGMDEPEEGQGLILSGLLPLTQYEVRARFRSFNGYATEWTLWIPVTTPDVWISDAALDSRMAQLTIAADVALERELQRMRETVDRVSHRIMDLWARLEKQDQIQINQTGAKTVQAFEEIATEREVRATALTAVAVRLDDPETGLIASANAIQVLESTVSSQGDTITANSAAITAVQSSLTTAQGDISANASAISALETTVTSQGNSITANATAITALESTVNHPSTGVAANASAISSLQTTVSSHGSQLSSQASSITTLESAVFHPSTGLATKASVTQVNTVESNLNTLTGEHNSLAQSFTNVFVSNASGDAAAQLRMIAAAGPSGFDATIRLEARASGDSFSAARAAFQIDVADGQPSRIRLIADRTVFATGTGTGATIKPLLTISSNLIHMHADVRMGFAQITNVQIGTAHIDNLAVTNAKIANLTIDTGKIALGAITDADASSGTSDEASVTISNSLGAPVVISAYAVGVSAAGTIGVLLRRGSTTLDSYSRTSAAGVPHGFPIHFHDASPPTGSSQYRVTLTGSPTPTAVHTGIIVLVRKR